MMVGGCADSSACSNHITSHCLAGLGAFLSFTAESGLGRGSDIRKKVEWMGRGRNSKIQSFLYGSPDKKRRRELNSHRHRQKILVRQLKGVDFKRGIYGQSFLLARGFLWHLKPYGLLAQNPNGQSPEPCGLKNTSFPPFPFSRREKISIEKKIVKRAG
jgi:hypothetical protein